MDSWYASTLCVDAWRTDTDCNETDGLVGFCASIFINRLNWCDSLVALTRIHISTKPLMGSDEMEVLSRHVRWIVGGFHSQVR